MAISPKDIYPGQIDVSDLVSWPEGRAINLVVPGDGSGTPFEQQWLSDLFGWQQALLGAAGLTPDGTIERVGNSQYLDAINELINQHDFTDGLLVSAGGFQLFGGGVISGDTTFQGGDFVFNEPVTINDPLTVTGNVVLGNASTDTVTIAGTLTANGLSVTTDIGLTGDLVVGNDLAVTGAGIFLDTISVLGAATFGGVTTFNAGIAMGSALVGGVLAMTGTGHVRDRLVEGADAATDYGIDDADFIHVQSITAPRTYTLQATAAANGDRITVRTNETTDILTIAGISAGNQLMRNSPGEVRVATFVYFTGQGWVREHLTFA